MSKDKFKSVAQLQALLREAGLRSTAPRIAVLKSLLSAQRPLSHNELSELLEKEGHDKTTIFRNLTDMTEVGLVSRIDVGDHTWRFETRNIDNQEDSNHAHFVCTDCGDVDCLSDLDLTVSSKKKGKAKVGKVSEILLKGHCDDCEDNT